MYYAQEDSNDSNSEPIILEVFANTKDLIIDWNSLCEPVGYRNILSKELEDIIDEYSRKLEYSNPGWVNEKRRTMRS